MSSPTPGGHVDVVFDGPPGPEAGRFVELENEAGKSISLGEWINRGDGFWALRLPLSGPDLTQLRARAGTPAAPEPAVAAPEPT